MYSNVYIISIIIDFESKLYKWGLRNKLKMWLRKLRKKQRYLFLSISWRVMGGFSIWMEIFLKEIGGSSKMKRLNMVMANFFSRISYNRIAVNRLTKEIGSMIQWKALEYILMWMVILIRVSGRKISTLDWVKCNSLMEHLMMDNGKTTTCMVLDISKIIWGELGKDNSEMAFFKAECR